MAGEEEGRPLRPEYTGICHLRLNVLGVSQDMSRGVL